MKPYKLPRRLVRDRIAWILEQSRGKRVLHLGFVGHPNLQRHLEGTYWLHRRLVEVASEVVGVDSAEHDVARLQAHEDLGTMLYGDAERLDELDLKPFDLVIAGEILEHLHRPGDALDGMRRKLAPGGRLLITVPNAYCLRRMIRIPFGWEMVHHDHVAYYSHRTLTRLLSSHGYAVEFAAGYRVPPDQSTKKNYLLDRVASWISPNLCDGLAYRARAEA
ncbi:MAG: class I SAM-dependent methyltransferase [Gemmatimonadetes bacterium]|nr:class I SAM-dependent methyltransferase [Gemmatimonadota bacterium]